MRRYFRVVDCSRHCGLPVRIACIVLDAIATVMYGFVLYFLPAGAAYPLMITQAVVGCVGLLACLTPLRIATLLYIIAQSLMIIPVWVVMGYVIYVLINFNNYCYGIRYNYHYWCGTAWEISLRYQGLGWLWTILAIGFFGTVFSSTALQGFRKLKLHQAGVARVQHGVPQNVHTTSHCHQPTTVVLEQRPPVVVQQPVYAVPQPQQTTVYTTYTTPQMVGAQPQVVTQSMYPTIPAQQPTNVVYQY